MGGPGRPWTLGRPRSPTKLLVSVCWKTSHRILLVVGRQANVLDRPAPSMSRDSSAAHHRGWAVYAMSLGFRGYPLRGLATQLPVLGSELGDLCSSGLLLRNLKLSYCNKETLLLIVYPYSGNLSPKPS